MNGTNRPLFQPGKLQGGSAPSATFAEEKWSRRRKMWQNAVIFSLPVSALLGAFFLSVSVLGKRVDGFQMIVLALTALTVGSCFRRYWWRIPLARNSLLFGAWWASWGVVSFQWASDLYSAERDVLGILLGFAVLFVLLNLAAYREPGLAALRRGWCCAVAVGGGVALWEWLTGNHLPNPVLDDYVPRAWGRGVALATLANPNDFGAFLVLAFPFLHWSARVDESGFRPTGYRLLFVLHPLFLVLTSSRLSILGIAAQLLTYGFLSRNRWRKEPYFFLYVAVFTGCLVWASAGGNNLSEKVSTDLSHTLNSPGRLPLLLNGLMFFLQSWGVGVGAGNFEYRMQHGESLFPSNGLVNPHNFWIEVLSEYGWPVFLPFMALLGYLGLLAISALREPRGSNLRSSRAVAEAIMLALAGYVFAAVASSSYMLKSLNWVFLASVFVLGVSLQARRKEASAAP